VDASPSGRADVLWNGTHLFVLIYKGTTASFSKYTYDGAGTYTRIVGPVTITLSGGTSESATIDQDSTGRLWIVYDPDINIRVFWSDPVNHALWDPTGMTINTLPTLAGGDDLAGVVAFTNCLGATSNNCIGVLWSDQNSDSVRFRIHRDEDLPGTWQTEEVAAQGGLVADDHINVKATDVGDILAATKSSTEIPPGNSADETNLLVRQHTTGAWQKFPITAGGTVPETASRPITVFDSTNQDVYVFFTGRFDSAPRERTISYKVANLSQLGDMGGTAAIEVIGGAGTGLSVNNPTSTKQTVTDSTGLFVVAKGEDDSSTPTTGYYKLLDLASSTAPVINSFTATALTITSGQSTTLQWQTTNATAVSFNTGVPAGQPVDGTSRSVRPPPPPTP